MGSNKKIQESKCEKEFEKNKKLLLYYISIILKEGLAKFNKEVNRYTDIVAYVIGDGIIFLFLVLCCFYINLYDMSLLGIFIIYMMFSIAVFLWFTDALELLRSKRRSQSIDEIVKNERKARRKMFLFVVAMVFEVFVAGTVSFVMIPYSIKQNVKYCSDSNELWIYTNLGERLSCNIAVDLEKCTEKRVVVLQSSDELNVENDLGVNYDKEIKEVINQELLVIQDSVFLAMLMTFMFPMIVSTRNECKKSKLVVAVELEKCLLIQEDSKYLAEAIKILGIVKDMDDKQIMGKECNQLLGLELNLLLELKKIFNYKISSVEENLKTIEQFKKRAIYQKNIEIIQKSIKRLKKMRKGNKKREEIKNIRKQIKEIVSSGK